MKQKMLDIINKDFPKETREIVTECLSSINLTHVMGESEINLDNTLLSILYLAKGDVNTIVELTEKAKVDFRDVIYWAQLEQQSSIMDLPKTQEEFLERNYLKTDLIRLCKKHSLPTSGSKATLLKYISNFIEGKKQE